MDAEQIGKRILELRKEKGMTQKELADKLHVTDGAVSKWERGINFPDLSLMDTLAVALDTSVIQLLSLESATNYEVASVLSEISVIEKKRMVKELKFRAIINILIGLMLMVTSIIASKILSDNDIYGLAQVCTVGMLGFIGTLIGSEVYFIQHLHKL